MAGSESDSDVMQSLVEAAEAGGGGLPPVDRWNPEACGKMDLVIRRDGSWWHEGTRITRERLVRLFSRILRKDADGKTYLVTPVEKIEIEVEAAPFLAIRMDAEGEGKAQRIAFLTNMDEAVIAGPDHPIRVETGADGEPEPYVHVRGNLEALINRATFYDLAERAVEGEDAEGRKVMGVWSEGVFFPLGPKG
ncbi:DUF1285 domain-containing protein [Marinicauda algicola]|uniref:DUF1285 domain-containing protein n=1 Tax=Marinicauda algicola TaxID=2029849 RepID=A0A4S2GX30_9PROT|nr:DUF1285 domain-containing protein [Marinicauda algicola]TGY87593.1 DUF1285 domain-containing protein [Marinicauda algicola]